VRAARRGIEKEKGAWKHMLSDVGLYGQGINDCKSLNSHVIVRKIKSGKEVSSAA
jgi:hypothetical protein